MHSDAPFTLTGSLAHWLALDESCNSVKHCTVAQHTESESIEHEPKIKFSS